MNDESRLRTKGGSLEARLLRSAPKLEPPPSAQDELWRRLQALPAIGAAAATGAAIGKAATAGTNAVVKATWISIVKWGAIVVLGAPAIGVSAYYAFRREAASPAPLPAVSHSVAPPAPAIPTTPAPAIEPAPLDEAPRALHRQTSNGDAASALRAESRLLGSARAKLAAGDNAGALDDAARLTAQFPRGRLVQEREVVAIDALAAMGDRAAARTRASAFLKRFPNSPYAAHVRAIE